MKLFFACIIFIIFCSSVVAMEQINFSELSVEEKIGQMLIVKPQEIDSKWLNLKLGGIFVVNRNFSKEDYKKHISYYQNNSKIKLFIATDMEGYWNPFNFHESKNFGDIKTQEESFELGKDHAEILKDLGFNLNFSPVVEIRNNVWPGRSFTGTNQEIENKIKKYIEGLQSEEIIATAKHYPGGNLVKNPHLLKYKVSATKNELNMFDVAIKSDVGAIMVGHPIIYGELDSNGKQATISEEIIAPLKEDFNGLVITDAVTMLGLSWSYLFNFKKAYPDLVMAGNDIILDTHYFSNYNRIKRRISYLSKQAQKNPELMKRINESSKKILEKKGYAVID